MSIHHHFIPSTHGAVRRALILVLYGVILVAAVTQQAFQHRANTAEVYVQGDVAYVQAHDSTTVHPLFPLSSECDLRWTNGSQDSRLVVSDAPRTLFERVPLLRVAIVGDLTVIAGNPWVTLRAKSGDIQVMADCAPPAPPVQQVYIYVLGEHLFLYNTYDQELRLLMPLRELLLWTGDDTAIFALDQLVTRPEDRQGYAWLPVGATVLGDFATTAPIRLNNLDETQVQIRYGNHELTLVSYDRWTTP